MGSRLSLQSWKQKLRTGQIQGHTGPPSVSDCRACHAQLPWLSLQGRETESRFVPAS